MAPEIIKGQPYNAAVDIYSTGILMYSLLNNNRAPFLPPFPEQILPGDRENAQQKRISGEPLPELAHIHPHLNTVVLKACAYDRNQRYSHPAHMREALESIHIIPAEQDLFQHNTPNGTVVLLPDETGT
jgi:serine/threonine-protein kinase